MGVSLRGVPLTDAAGTDGARLRCSRYNQLVKLVYCGTPMFAVPPLDALVRAGHDVSLVVTQPDRPKGRGMDFALSPVKQKALALGLPISQPEKIKNNPEFQSQLESLTPECIVIVGYGRIVPRWMLDLPAYGNINLHASLLPKYRGAAPIQWAIAWGESVTGNTTMCIDEGLDTGDILLQRELPIRPEDTSVTLAPRLAVMGAELLVETLAALEEHGSQPGLHRLQPMPQDHERATLAPILTREDGRIDFAREARTICNRHCGFQPWPGAFTAFRGKQLTLHTLSLFAGAHALAEGEISTASELLLVGCGAGSAIAIEELQVEGKRRMSAREFINGYQPKPGERMGT
jgi:methionyl-tRNA formyltransferase